MQLGDKSVAEFAKELAQTPFFDELNPGALLKRVFFFKDVDEFILDEIAPFCILRILYPGDVVCRQGEYGDTFYILLQGKVEVCIETQENPRIVLAAIGKDEFFGEHAPLTESARTATVTATERSTIIEVGKEAFLKLREKCPNITKLIDEKYINRMLATQLRRVALFTTLPDEVIDALKSKVTLHEFNRGDVILRQGEEADSLYLIRAGFVKVRLGADENEKILAYLKDGSYFGEMSLLRGGKRNADIVAVTKVELVRINTTDFQELLGKYPEVGTRLEKVVFKRDEDSKTIDGDSERARKMKFAVNTGLVQAGRILLIDLDVCVRCNTCVEACSATHGGYPRIERSGQRFGKVLLPTSCMHCTDPECMLCPHGGIYRDKNGEIHHTVQCIHCGGCARRCPYDNILIIKLDDKKRSKKKGAGKKTEALHSEKKHKAFENQRVVKCDMCSDKNFVSCVYNCPVGACRAVTPEQFLELSTE